MIDFIRLYYRHLYYHLLQVELNYSNGTVRISIDSKYSDETYAGKYTLGKRIIVGTGLHKAKSFGKSISSNSYL
jgi:hypothetical protein